MPRKKYHREGRTELEAFDFVKPILPLIQRGMSIKQACKYANKCDDSVKKYIEKYKSVQEAVNTAEMMLLAVSLDTVSKAAKKDPNVALKVLEKRDRDNWGTNIDVTTNGENLSVALVEFVGNGKSKKK